MVVVTYTGCKDCVFRVCLSIGGFGLMLTLMVVVTNMDCKKCVHNVYIFECLDVLLSDCFSAD